MKAYSITLSLICEADSMYDALAAVQEMVAESLQERRDARFGTMLYVHGATDWHIVPIPAVPS